VIPPHIDERYSVTGSNLLLLECRTSRISIGDFIRTPPSEKSEKSKPSEKEGDISV